MASQEHLSLSEYIKSVHQQLRSDSKIMGSEQAWKRHCENEEQLQIYASAMKELAIKHWASNMSEKTKEMCRILWVRDVCMEYFCDTKLQYYRDKEKDIAIKININVDPNIQLNYSYKHLNLIDVGSCYNPFSIFKEYFDVLPIDIAPATPDVYKCDFLKVKIGACADIKLKEVLILQENSFDICVFSLLLEYLPSPEFRLICCKKAYSLLKYEGILIIITPDSKHVGANAKLMKSWRYILAKLGFSRIKYTKLQHIHCMVFRKSIFFEVAKRWADLHEYECFHDKMYIPQDFNSSNSFDDKT